METNYRKIEFGVGGSIEEAMQDLARFKERGELAYGVFNGQKLYSDVDDVDSAYKKVTGKTKAEFDAALKVEKDRYKEEEERHKDSMPQLTGEWIEKGNAILDRRYHEIWAECVPVRLDDLYQGMELGASLNIIKELNAGCELAVAKDILDGQGHSGMSFGLVCAMVKVFCDRGPEFVAHVYASTQR